MRVSCVLIALLLAPTGAVAQLRMVPVAPGDEVRVEVAGTRQQGYVLSSGEMLTILTEQYDTVRIQASDVDRLHRGEPRSRLDGATNYGIVGFLAGGFAGAVIGLAGAAGECERAPDTFNLGGDPGCMSAGASLWFAGVGGLLGAAIGITYGRSNPGTHWVPIPLEGVDVGFKWDRTRPAVLVSIAL